MTIRWFGHHQGLALNDECPEIDVPFGAVCVWCEDLIDEDDAGIQYVNGPVAHMECFMRQTIGGLNHLKGNCTCHGGTEDPDPPELTKREAAREAWAYFRAHGPR